MEELIVGKHWTNQSRSKLGQSGHFARAHGVQIRDIYTFKDRLYITAAYHNTCAFQGSTSEHRVKKVRIESLAPTTGGGRQTNMYK